jgi:hypothetical protein
MNIIQMTLAHPITSAQYWSTYNIYHTSHDLHIIINTLGSQANKFIFVAIAWSVTTRATVDVAVPKTAVKICWI